jgi:Vesicle coat complex COPI, zeta subunit
VEDLRKSFERQLQAKIQGISARPDAAEVVTVQGKTAVFCGGLAAGATPTAGGSGGDVRVVHVGPSSESELVLAHLCEGMYDALSHLMGGQTDRNMVLDNLELVFLLIDEHCDGGVVLEVDGHKLASSVLLRDEAEEGMVGGGGGGLSEGGGGEGAPSSGAAPVMGGFRGFGLQNGGDISIAQAFRQAKQQLIAGLQADGM